MNQRLVFTLAAIIAATWTLTASAAPGTCNGRQQRARLRDGSCRDVAAAVDQTTVTPQRRGNPNCPWQCPNWNPANSCPRARLRLRDGSCLKP